MDQAQSQPAVQPQSVFPPQPPKSKNWLWILGGVLLLGVGIVIGELFGKQLYSTHQSQLVPTLPPPVVSVMEGNPTANWTKFSNQQIGISFKHPQMDDSCCAIGLPKGQAFMVFAIKSTTREGTDKPFDGFGVSAVELGNLDFTQFVTSQEQLLISQTKEGESTQFNPSKSPITVAGINGTALVGHSGYDTEFIYVPYPGNNKVLIIAKTNEFPGSFDATFNQILSTFKFLNTQSSDQQNANSPVVVFDPSISVVAKAELVKKVVAPYIDYHQELDSNAKIVSISLTANTLTNKDRYPFAFEAIFAATGKKDLLLSQTNGQLDWWVPEYASCDRTPNFPKKYPESGKTFVCK